mmetsp:Transcript_7810/g.24871  ORF Transcript_7810/g.24871 Transcript_7810/m.24871 type:complete len:208 (-) Transcript_7810:591-1214(-)
MPSSGLPKKPNATSPQRPQAPCTAKASTTSSTFRLRMAMEVPWYTIPPISPMIAASQGFTTAQPAVMDTSPARMPLQKPLTSKSFGGSTWALSKKTNKPATHGESVVFAATRPAVCAVASSCIEPVLPALKPYQPNHRKKVPSTQKGMLCPSKAVASAASQRPLRGPTATAPHSAPTPPTRCTRPLPAKSMSAGPTAEVLLPVVASV